MDKKRIKPIIPFIRKVEVRFKPEKIILFGSRARGDYFKDSDYDILIIANSFKKMGLHDRSVSVYHLKNVPVGMDIICLTPEEFEQKKKQFGTIQQAAKEGIEIN